MYLIGTFSRDYFDFSNNENPLSVVGLVNEITREHLGNAKQDDDYQVINLERKEYYEPKRNEWIKIKFF